MTSIIITDEKLEAEAKKHYNKVYLEKKINFKEGMRKNFESRSKCYIKDLEIKEKKDHLHYRKSGVDQVLAKLARDKKKVIFFNLNLLKEKQKIPADVILGRMQFNIKLCRKYDVDMKAGFVAKSTFEIKNPQDVKSFLKSIGMSDLEAKKALEF